jgi:hypothetical protein
VTFFAGAFISLYPSRTAGQQPYWSASCSAHGSRTWLGLAFAHTAESLLWADLLFFVAAAAVIFCLSRKSPKVQMIEPRAPGRAAYDWITRGGFTR